MRMPEPRDEDAPPQVQNAGRRGGVEDFTVFYEGRYLYSRFAPQKSILNAVENARVEEHTLVMCFSPALCYGVENLSKKIPQHSAMVLIERDKALFELALSRLKKDALAHNVFVLSPDQLPASDKIFESPCADFLGRSFPKPGTFRRVMRIDFSAGTALDARFYDALERALEGAVFQFWKNRATLMYLGRLYCRNFFLNLARLPFSRPLESARVDLPILVVASGPSADELLARGAQAARNFFVIAADTALPALLARGIEPDLVVQVEAQFAIEAAFISAGKKKFPLAADLASRNHRADYYFFSRFAPCAFMENLKKKGILPLEIPPMGSVALYALEIALKMRQSEQIPVFVCGVDFAFTAGKTHCKGTPAHVLQLIKANRLCPAGDVAAAFREGAFAVKSKNASQTLITDHALMGYRDAFCARFLGTPNVFDAGEQGLPLNLPRAKLESRAKTFEGAQHKAKDAEEKRDSKALRALIAKYFTSEEAALVNLRGILSGKIQMESGAREEQIFALLEGREYLFLHFPDGFSPSAETQFLTRVRAEIDFFLKDIARAKKSLNA